jgi:hypothetical protein
VTMPVKRRRLKRRFSEAAELEAWGEYFKFGWAGFTGDLEAIGVTDPAGEAQSAWDRLGAAFLSTWKPADIGRTPWALVQFGRPKGGRHAR